MLEKLTSSEACVPSGNLVVGYLVSNFVVDVLMDSLSIRQILKPQSQRPRGSASFSSLHSVVCKASPFRLLDHVSVLTLTRSINVTSALRATYTRAIDETPAAVSDALN